ncbi:MAG: hypothetical protein DME50_13125 [Verrucomicrobia bacterium]|nr:MAG: hypothetical protein DME85_08480 [Verrucomicrobiota bacterium]PYK64525.1 MAG: hypothetical protein DME50_13125 [Verrucomicrobiota bacterium]
MKPKPHTLADAHEAALRLILLPDDPDLTTADLDFLRSDLVGELLEGRWPRAFRWTSYRKQN